MLCPRCHDCMLEVRDYTGVDVWVCVWCERVEELKLVRKDTPLFKPVRAMTWQTPDPIPVLPPRYVQNGVRYYRRGGAGGPSAC